jgi:hypothetical protein
MTTLRKLPMIAPKAAAAKPKKRSNLQKYEGRKAKGER